MSCVKPFAALRPTPALAARVCELPYDVLSAEEARQLAAGNPWSFFHVSKPEIDLPDSADPHSPAVYAKGAENFQRLIQQGALCQDSKPGFYFYRQIMGRHSQIGLVAAASCEDYLRGVVKKHELTRPDKEDDRVRHIEALNSQTGPVFLVYRARPEVDAFVAQRTAATPAIDFTGGDGVRHSAWVVADDAGIAFVQEQFRQIPALYIADGHHRSAAAARVYQSRKGAGQSAFFLSVIFPHNQVQILPYNRVLKDLNGNSSRELLEKLERVCVVEAAAAPSLARKHEVGLYLPGQWYHLRFRQPVAASADPVEDLDVTLLQKQVLQPLLGIDDPRTSKRIGFVGGIRGNAELEKLVQSGAGACAFSLFPTSIEDLMSVADAGGLMPPKSTWFEPKLRDAMFCHGIA
jgi:uncharacterized protein (DUF1015 family)